CGGQGFEGAALTVALADHYCRPELTSLNEGALAAGAAWMACKLVGQTAWIGPIFRPGRTGCLTCLRERLRLNRQVEDFVYQKTGDLRSFDTSLASSPATLGLGAASVAQEVALWLAGRAERLEGRLISLTATTGGVEAATHPLTRRPQCPSCGEPGSGRETRPPLFERRPFLPAVEGGYRTETA